MSIVIPSYNQALFLERCLNSVLDQDYPNIECIVIDGGSTDGSVDIIRRYEDRLTYWVSEPDRGQSHAINKGFQRTTGDIVAWLNSDDLYFPGAVSLAVKCFQNNSKLVLFYGHCVFVDEKGSFLRYFTEVEPWNKKRLLNYSDYIMQPTTFFSREKLFQVGLIDETLNYGMDWDLWCKLIHTGDVHFEEQLIAANREYGATKTMSGGWIRLKELLRIQRRHMQGFWPHAFWGYCGTELRLRASASNSFLSWILWRCAALIVPFLSPSAIVSNRLMERRRNLYGIQHHSGKIPDGQAKICLPIASKTAIVILTLQLAPGSRVGVKTPDISKEFTSNSSLTSVRLPIGKNTLSRGVWSAIISIVNNEGKPEAGEVVDVNWEKVA